MPDIFVTYADFLAEVKLKSINKKSNFKKYTNMLKNSIAMYDKVISDTIKEVDKKIERIKSLYLQSILIDEEWGNVKDVDKAKLLENAVVYQDCKNSYLKEGKCTIKLTDILFIEGTIKYENQYKDGLYSIKKEIEINDFSRIYSIYKTS